MTPLMPLRSTAVSLISGLPLAANSVDLHRFCNLRQSRSLVGPFHDAAAATARIAGAVYFGGKGHDDFSAAFGIDALPTLPGPRRIGGNPPLETRLVPFTRAHSQPRSVVKDFVLPDHFSAPDDDAHSCPEFDPRSPRAWCPAMFAAASLLCKVEIGNPIAPL